MHTLLPVVRNFHRFPDVSLTDFIVRCSIYVRRVFIILPSKFKIPFVLFVVSTRSPYSIVMTVVHGAHR